MILGVRACIPLFAATPRTRQTHGTPGPWVMSSLDPLTELILDAARSVD
jgi:hypothetical protein